MFKVCVCLCVYPVTKESEVIRWLIFLGLGNKKRLRKGLVVE